MLYNLTSIFSSEQSEIEIKIPFESDTVSNGYETFVILEKSDVALKLKNQQKGEVLVDGECEIVCEIPCGRCLKAVSHTMKLEIHEYIKEDDIGNPETADEIPYMEGYELNVDQLVGNEIMINWPMKILCKEDCKGICNVCGKDLNDGECGCDTFVPDPRLAVLKDIFNV